MEKEKSIKIKNRKILMILLAIGMIFVAGFIFQRVNSSQGSSLDSGEVVIVDQAEFEKICKQDGNQWMNMKPMKNGNFVSDKSCFGCMSPDGMNHFCDITEYKSFIEKSKQVNSR